METGLGEMSRVDLPSTSHLSEVTRHTGERGRQMGDALQVVFDKVGFDPELITAHGALCLDVGFGPEIEAVRRYSPRILVVSEELDNLQPNLAGREESLKQLGEGLPLHIVRGSVYRGMDYVVKNLQTKVGLVTQLNTFPKSLTAKYTTRLFDEAASILVPGGIALVSATKEDAQKASEQLEKVILHQKNSAINISILRLDPDDSLRAGQTFLVARNNIKAP